MSDPSKPLQTNNQQTPAIDGQTNENSNPNSNNNPENQEMTHSIPMIQQQPILHPIQSIPIHNPEETFNTNNQSYPNFIPNNNFAIQAAASIALANQHPQLQPLNTSKNKNLKSNPLNNLNMNQVLTSISSFQNFGNFNAAQPNALNALAFGTKKAISRHKFSIDEDNLLRRLVEEHGTTNWRFIADNMPGRSARQCRDRWKNYLMPGIKNTPWTPDEDQLLEEKFAVLGPQWSRIAKFFPNRTDINVKNRWATRNGRVNKAQPIIDMHSTNANDNNNSVNMTLAVGNNDINVPTIPSSSLSQAITKPVLVEQFPVKSVSADIPMNQTLIKSEADSNNIKQINENIGDDANSQNDDGGGETK